MKNGQQYQLTNWRELDLAAPIWDKTPMEVLERLSPDTLKAFIHAAPCLACGTRDVDVAHIKTRGSSGSDDAWNIIPLCRVHHSLQHQSGWQSLFKSYPQVKEKLTEMGWEIGLVLGEFKMFHPKNAKGEV